MEPDKPNAPSQRAPSNQRRKRTRSKVLNWTAIASIVGAITAAIVAINKKPTNQTNVSPVISPIISPHITVNGGNPNNTTVALPAVRTEIPSTNSPSAKPAVAVPALTDAQKQLLEEAQQEGEIKMMLAPFLATSEPAKKPSYSRLKPMLAATTNGLDAIYKFLRETNSMGGPWIPAAPPRDFLTTAGALDWTHHDPTAQLLIERQQLLRKYAVVLVRSGAFGP